jgi:hypothetical protein
LAPLISILTEESKLTVHVGDPYVTYSLAVDQKNFRKDYERLRSFVMNNDSQIHRLAMDISKSHRKMEERLISEKQVQCRVPPWFNKTNLDVPDAIALILYFVGKPLTTRQITQVMNMQFKKIDLRNVSKYLTSRTSDLYGYTLYDDNTSTYSISVYGKSWLETELINTIKNRIQDKAKGKKKSRKINLKNKLPID